MLNMEQFIEMIKTLPEEHQKFIVNRRISKLEKMNDDCNSQIALLIKSKSDKSKSKMVKTLLIHRNLIILMQMKAKINSLLPNLYEFYSKLYETDELEDYCCNNCLKGVMCSYDKAEYWADY